MHISVATSAAPLPSTSARTIRSSGVNTDKANNNQKLDDQELKQVQELKARDREVRAHEAAHVAAGGNLVRGGASFSYQRGPDGAQYAIGGEVNIDTSKVPNDPRATLTKANQIRRAALAPAEPSSQDRAVAAKAAQMAIEARAEINQEKAEESGLTNNTNPFSSNNGSSTGNFLDFNI